MRPLFALAAICLLSACLPEEETVELQTSAQGIEFAFLPMPDSEMVSIAVSWPQPWASRAQANRAVPYLAPDLMVAGGAEGFAPGALMETFADLGAEASLYTQFDSLRGSVMAPPDALDGAIAAANAVLRAPSFAAEWQDRLQSDLLAAQVESNAASATQGFYALRLGMLGDTPYTEHISLMDTEAIAAVTADDLRAWHSETIVRAGMRVAVAGPISAAQARVAVDDLLANLPQGTAQPSTDITFAGGAAKTVLLHLPDAEKTTLALVAPLPPSGTDADADDVIGAIALGGDDQSLLFAAIRTQLRASYSMAAGLDNFGRKARILVMSGEVETATLAAAKDAALAAYAQMQSTPISPELLLRWRDPIIDGVRDAVERDSFMLANSMVEAQLDGVEPQVVQRLPAMFGAVTRDSIQKRYANDYPALDDIWVLAISPDANALPGACVITAPRQVLDCP